MSDALPVTPETRPMTRDLFIHRNVASVRIRRDGVWVRVARPDTVADLDRLIDAVRQQAQRELRVALGQRPDPDPYQAVAEDRVYEANRDREII